MDLSIIIVNYRTPKLCENCIASIHNALAGETFSYEIVLVDNRSNDGSFEQLKMLEDEYTHVFETERNGGFGYGNNRGVERARGEYLFFLNSDTILYPKTLPQMYEYIIEHQDVGIMGCLMKDGDDIPLVSAHPFENTKSLFIQTIIKPLVPDIAKRYRGKVYVEQQPLQTVKCDWVSGAAILMSKDLFEHVGGWDERFFMYMEDEELCFRVQKAGYAVMVYPAYGLQHLVGKSGGSAFLAYERYKSKKLFFSMMSNKSSRVVNGLLYFQCWCYMKGIRASEKMEIIKRLMKLNVET